MKQGQLAEIRKSRNQNSLNGCFLLLHTATTTWMMKKSIVNFRRLHHLRATEPSWTCDLRHDPEPRTAILQLSPAASSMLCFSRVGFYEQQLQQIVF